MLENLERLQEPQREASSSPWPASSMTRTGSIRHQGKEAEASALDRGRCRSWSPGAPPPALLVLAEAVVEDRGGPLGDPHRHALTPCGGVFDRGRDHVGESELAGEALERLVEVTQPAGTDWALGTQARSRALLGDGESAEDLYPGCRAVRQDPSAPRTRSRAPSLWGIPAVPEPAQPSSGTCARCSASSPSALADKSTPPSARHRNRWPSLNRRAARFRTSGAPCRPTEADPMSPSVR